MTVSKLLQEKHKRDPYIKRLLCSQLTLRSFEQSNCIVRVIPLLLKHKPVNMTLSYTLTSGIFQIVLSEEVF